MRLRILSDLHEEFASRFARSAQDSGELPFAPVEADLTILAGDIANGVGAVAVAAQEAFAAAPVVLVAGNHEYYSACMQDVHLAMLAAALDSGRRIYLLQQQTLEWESVRILGCTLWTDYALDGVERREEVMRLAKPHMADYRLIERNQGVMLTAADTVQMHQAQRAWLKQELAKPWPGKTVVVTHHAPHPQSVAARFAGNPINGGFVSNLEALMPGVDLWVHGHTHDGFDYRVDHADGRSTRVVANPAGYRKRLPDGSYLFENPRFDPNLIVEL